MELYTLKQLDLYADIITKLTNGIHEADIRYTDSDGLPKHLLTKDEQALINWVLDYNIEVLTNG